MKGQTTFSRGRYQQILLSDVLDRANLILVQVLVHLVQFQFFLFEFQHCPVAQSDEDYLFELTAIHILPEYRAEAVCERWIVLKSFLSLRPQHLLHLIEYVPRLRLV